MRTHLNWYLLPSPARRMNEKARTHCPYHTFEGSGWNVSASALIHLPKTEGLIRSLKLQTCQFVWVVWVQEFCYLHNTMFQHRQSSKKMLSTCQKRHFWQSSPAAASPIPISTKHSVNHVFVVLAAHPWKTSPSQAPFCWTRNHHYPTLCSSPFLNQSISRG